MFGGMGRHPEENAACGPKGGVVFEGAHLSLGLQMSSTAPCGPTAHDSIAFSPV